MPKPQHRSPTGTGDGCNLPPPPKKKKKKKKKSSKKVQKKKKKKDLLCSRKFLVDNFLIEVTCNCELWPDHEQTCLWDFWPGCTQTGILSYTALLEFWNIWGLHVEARRIIKAGFSRLAQMIWKCRGISTITINHLHSLNRSSSTATTNEVS